MNKSMVVILAVLLFAGCAPNTQITASWKNDDALPRNGNLQSILVAALTGTTNTRQAMEREMSAALAEQGYNTITSMELLPPTFTNVKPDKNDLMAKIGTSRVDAILTVAMIDEETETRYVPGNVGYAPIPRFGYYGTFWGYYTNWYPLISSPGYYEEDKVYFIETNLYDARTEQLLWSAQSETYNPSNLPDFADEFSQVVVSRLERDEVLNGGETELARERQNDRD